MPIMIPHWLTIDFTLAFANISLTPKPWHKSLALVGEPGISFLISTLDHGSQAPRTGSLT